MKVIIIGGGAAGMMAAYQAAKCGNDVSLYEKNEKLGKKIFITGKGQRMHYLQSADEYVHRRTSVKENVSVVSRESLLVLDVWNVSSQTGIWQTPKKQKLILRRTE